MGKGGNRTGSGRPAKGYGAILLRMPGEDIELIRSTARELGMTHGQVVHEMIDAYRENAREGR